MKTIHVNLQQGFITDDLGNIVAAYSHHHKVVVVKIPWHSNDFDWAGTPFEDYEMVNRATDSFSIECYTDKGNVSLTDLILATT